MKTPSCHAHPALTAPSRDRRVTLAGARKAQTHLVRVIEMLEHDQYCVDVLQQALAVQGLLKGVIRRVFEDHLKTCFSDAVTSGSAAQKKRVIEELVHVMDLSNRS